MYEMFICCAAPRHLQLQSDSRTLPSPESEFVGHCMHAAEPASDLQVSARPIYCSIMPDCIEIESQA